MKLRNSQVFFKAKEEDERDSETFVPYVDRFLKTQD